MTIRKSVKRVERDRESERREGERASDSERTRQRATCPAVSQISNLTTKSPQSTARVRNAAVHTTHARDDSGTVEPTIEFNRSHAY